MKTKFTRRILLATAALISAFQLFSFSAFSAETVPQTQTILKSYFQTGSIPTSTNYAELIDTMFYYVGEMSSNSAATLSAIQTLVTNQPSHASYQGNFSTPYTAFSVFNLTNSYNIATVSNYQTTVISGSLVDVSVHVNFSSPLANTNYSVYFPFTSTNITYRSVFSNDVSGFSFKFRVDHTVGNPLYTFGVSAQ